MPADTSSISRTTFFSRRSLTIAAAGAMIWRPDYLYAEALANGDGDGAGQNLTKAIAAVKKALQIEPGYQPARDLLCTLLLKTNQFSRSD